MFMIETFGLPDEVTLQRLTYFYSGVHSLSTTRCVNLSPTCHSVQEPSSTQPKIVFCGHVRLLEVLKFAMARFCWKMLNLQ